MPRILISSFAISPFVGSEAGVGWQIISRLLNTYQITVLASPIHLDFYGRNQHLSYENDMQRFFQLSGCPSNLNIVFVPPTKLSKILQRESFPYRQTSMYIGYASWQKRVLAAAVKLHHKQPFDLVHHLTFTGFREPGYLWKLGIPFVWGPITGAYSMPWSFIGQLGTVDKIFQSGRKVTSFVQKYFGFRSRLAAKKAVRVWAATEDERKLVRAWGYDASLLSETGATKRNATPQSRTARGTLKLCWSGLHIGRKALPILLKALALIKETDISLRVIGDGPESVRWQQLADKLGLADRVEWLGRLPNQEAIKAMSDCHVFVFPSTQEGTPHVLLEALSLGLPVICHEACGMATIIDNSCGLKIPLISPAQSVKCFAVAIQRLAGDRGFVADLSLGALNRAESCSWDKLAAQIRHTYHELLLTSNKNIRSPREINFP